MSTEWPSLLGRAAVPLAVALAFALARKFLRPTPQPDEPTLDMLELSERFSTTQWLVGMGEAASVVVVGYSTYRLLVWANLTLATADGPSQYLLLPSKVIWMFFPGFLALATPWELVRAIWGLWADRCEIRLYERWGNQKLGFDGPRALRWLMLLIALPVGIATALALPMHRAVGDDGIRDRSFASARSVNHAYSDAIALAHVDGLRLKNGAFQPNEDLLVKFADGTTWHASFSGDNVPLPQSLTGFVAQKTSLSVQFAKTAEDLPW